jgi:hypothetical protein
MGERSFSTFVSPRVWAAQNVGLSYTLTKDAGHIHDAKPPSGSACKLQHRVDGIFYGAEDGAAMTIIETDKPLAARYAIALWLGASILLWLTAATVAVNF